MSFSNGFEKTAALGKAIGAVAGTAAKAGRTATKAVGEFATKQRIGRVGAYRQASTGRPAAFAGGDPAKQKAVLGRMDQMKANKVKSGKSIFEKHPFMTAGATLLGAKALMGNDQQKAPPPPPQVIQY